VGVATGVRWVFSFRAHLDFPPPSLHADPRGQNHLTGDNDMDYSDHRPTAGPSRIRQVPCSSLLDRGDRGSPRVFGAPEKPEGRGPNGAAFLPAGRGRGRPSVHGPSVPQTTRSAEGRRMVLRALSSKVDIGHNGLCACSSPPQASFDISQAWPIPIPTPFPAAAAPAPVLDQNGGRSCWDAERNGKLTIFRPT